MKKNFAANRTRMEECFRKKWKMVLMILSEKKEKKINKKKEKKMERL